MRNNILKLGGWYAVRCERGRKKEAPFYVFFFPKLQDTTDQFDNFTCDTSKTPFEYPNVGFGQRVNNHKLLIEKKVLLHDFDNALFTPQRHLFGSVFTGKFKYKMQPTTLIR